MCLLTDIYLLQQLATLPGATDIYLLQQLASLPGAEKTFTCYVGQLLDTLNGILQLRNDHWVRERNIYLHISTQVVFIIIIYYHLIWLF